MDSHASAEIKRNSCCTLFQSLLSILFVAEKNGFFDGKSEGKNLWGRQHMPESSSFH